MIVWFAKKPKIPRRRTSFGLPQYYYDPSTGRYHDARSKKFVARSKIVDLLRDVTDRTEETMANIARLQLQGRITAAQSEKAMQLVLKQAYNANAALAAGGWDRLTRYDYARNGGLLRAEYYRIHKLVMKIEEGDLSEAQAVVQAGNYANSAYGRYWDIRRTAGTQQGYQYERWVTLGDDRVCPICLDLESQGWQPVHTFAEVPGRVHPGCRCDLEFAKEIGKGAFAVLLRGLPWTKKVI